jgi:hypothetical protein
MSAHSARPRPTLARQLRAAATLALVLLVLAGAAYGVWWFTVGRPVLAGDRRFDFGAVPFVGEPVRLEHTFVLRNRGRRPVEIRDIRTTCGCAVAVPNLQVLEPDETVEVAATLTLKREGIREARIILLYDDGTKRDTLHVRGAAQRSQRLGFLPGPATVGADQPLERVLLYIDYDSNRQPPAPRITAPDGLRAEFTQWTQTARRARAKGLPARWTGPVRIHLDGEAVPAGATVTAEVGADQKVELSIASE